MLTPRKPALIFIFITLLLDILGIGLIVPILPKLITQLQGQGAAAGAHTYGVLAALYSLMQFLFSPLLGSLSDKFGRRPVILASLFGGGLDYILMAFAPNLTWFFVGRIVSGITGANFTAATAYIADISPPEKRAQNFGMIGMAFGLGFIFGPAIGGVLGNVDLKLPFLAAAGLTLINWLYGLFVLPESHQAGNRRAVDWKKANPVSALMALRKYPVVFGLAGMWFLLGLAHQVFPSCWALYTGHRFQWTPQEIGFSLAAVGVTAAIVQGGLTRRLIPLWGERRSVVIGVLIGMFCFVLYGLAWQGWMIYVIILLGAIGGVGTPAAQGIISSSVGSHEQGNVQGILNSLASIAGILGPLIATSLFGYFVSDNAPIKLPGAPFLFSAVLNAAALLLAVLCFRRSPAERS